MLVPPMRGNDCCVDLINIAQPSSYQIKIWVDVDNLDNVVYDVMV